MLAATIPSAGLPSRRGRKRHAGIASAAEHQATELILRIFSRGRLLDLNTLLDSIEGSMIYKRFMGAFYRDPLFLRPGYNVLILEGLLLRFLADQLS